MSGWLSSIGRAIGVVPHGRHEPPESSEPEADWTLLYYGDLEAARKLDTYFEQASSVRDCHQVEVLAQVADEDGVRRLRLAPGGVESKEVAAEPFTGGAIRDFLSWGIKHYPAKRYVVVLNGHSRGHGGIFGDEKRSAVSTPELAAALEAAAALTPSGKLDAVVSATCYSAAAEVAYEMKEGVDFYAASEDTLDSRSFKLPEMIDLIEKDPSVEPKELMKHLIDHLSQGPAITFSAVDLREIGALAGPLSRLKKALGGLEMDFVELMERCRQIPQAGSSETLRYFHPEGEGKPVDFDQSMTQRYRSLGGLAEMLSSEEFSPEIRRAAGDVSEALSEILIDSFTREGWKPMSGLTILGAETPSFAPRRDTGDYHQLELCRDTGWNGILRS